MHYPFWYKTDIPSLFDGRYVRSARADKPMLLPYTWYVFFWEATIKYYRILEDVIYIN